MAHAPAAIEAALPPDLKARLVAWGAARAPVDRPARWARRTLSAVGARLGLPAARRAGWSARLIPVDEHNLADISALPPRDEATRLAGQAWRALGASTLADRIPIGCRLGVQGRDGAAASGDRDEVVVRLDSRLTLTFTTRPRRSQDFEALSGFLIRHGALDCDHYVGTLHDHLMRAYARLEARGFGRDVCLGAGLHSVYGTSLLQHRMLGHSQRPLVRDAFGEGAEQLAYLFSILDRPRTLAAPLALDAEAARVELGDGQELEISRRAFDDLRWMECANLADQDTLKDFPPLQAYWAL